MFEIMQREGRSLHIPLARRYVLLLSFSEPEESLTVRLTRMSSPFTPIAVIYSRYTPTTSRPLAESLSLLPVERYITRLPTNDLTSSTSWLMTSGSLMSKFLPVRRIVIP